VFAKQPEPGQVKTRLAAATSAEWAARVAGAFLRDLVGRLEAVAARRVLAYTPASAGPYFADFLPGCFDLVAQGTGDLGGRLGAFFADQLANGAGTVVVLGTDSPTVPIAVVEQAFMELTWADVVLGPATDGGYYLVGCARSVPPIFDGIAWSTRHVLAETICRLSDSPARLALLPPWYDVDTLEDWWTLQGHVAALRRAGIDPGLPHTEELFRDLPWR
jgi:rSAM/selenodomain-associated transferase 1